MLRISNQRIRFIRLLFFIVVFSIINIKAERQKEYIFQQNLGLAVNPLGLLLDSRLLYRIPLSQDTGILFKTAQFEAGFINEWSPGDELFGVGINYEPLAIFNIRATGGFYENYKTFCYGYRILAGKNSPYHDTIVADLPQHTRIGTRLTVAPSLKMKVASVILADNFTFHKIDIFNEEGYFYEIRTALPHAAHDWHVANDVLLLYEVNSKVLVGGNHNLIFVKGTDIRQQKLGGMGIYTVTSGKRVRSWFGLITCGVYLESALRKHSFYIAALTGFELPLSRK